MSLPLVTQVLWKLDRGGAERMVLELATRLPRYGFRVRVVAAGGGGVMEEDFRAAHVPLTIGPAIGPRGRLETLRFLKREVHAHWPNVWHTHLGGDVWGGMVARWEGIHPWISTVHDVQPQSLLKGVMRGRALRAADRVVCISEYVRRYLAGTHGRERDVDVIRLGVERVDSAHSVPLQRRLQRFLVVGRLVPGKRIHLLIQALSALREPWELDIVGDGPERGRLEELVRTLQLRPRVHFVGSVADVRPFLASADAFLFASEEEGQGLAVLEAVAAGLPVLATDLPVLRELFDEYSMTVVPRDAGVSTWTEAVQELMYAPAEAEARAREAQAIVRKHCSIERMVSAYAALYHEMIRTPYAHSSRQ